MKWSGVEGIEWSRPRSTLPRSGTNGCSECTAALCGDPRVSMWTPHTTFTLHASCQSVCLLSDVALQQQQQEQQQQEQQQQQQQAQQEYPHQKKSKKNQKKTKHKAVPIVVNSGLSASFGASLLSSSSSCLLDFPFSATSSRSRCLNSNRLNSPPNNNSKESFRR